MKGKHMSYDLYEQLRIYAHKDLNDCKKRGYLFVTDTQSGNIEITYKKESGFDFTKLPSLETIRKGLDYDQAKAFLVSLYDLVITKKEASQ